MKNRLMCWLYISLTLVVVSCKKQVEVDPPLTSLVTKSVFSNDNTATAAQLSIYAQMYLFPWDIHRIMALSSDEFDNYASDQTSIDLYMNSLNATMDGSYIDIWPSGYNYIYQENAILEGVKNSTTISARVKKQLTGEAEFMRAYYYFYLINLFGDVPFITSTDYSNNANSSRTAKDLVYQNIILDLKNAQIHLSTNYVDATDTTISSDRVRPTTWAASALLARIYLYTGKYDSAEAQATIVIGNTAKYMLPADLNQVFKKNSSEAIWQIVPPSTTYSTTEGQNFIMTTGPGSDLSNSTSISQRLLDAFEVNDLRKDNWIGSYTDGTDTWYFPYKYKDGNDASSLQEYTIMLRLAEQYLIRGEARLQQGNTSGAVSDLNAIRNRAGLLDYSGPTDKDSLETAIIHERQVELFTEGDRWIDLKRTKKIDAVMGMVTQEKGGVKWDTNQQLYPLPIADIKSDTKLVQNAGY